MIRLDKNNDNVVLQCGRIGLLMSSESLQEILGMDLFSEEILPEIGRTSDDGDLIVVKNEPLSIKSISESADLTNQMLKNLILKANPESYFSKEGQRRISISAINQAILAMYGLTKDKLDNLKKTEYGGELLYNGNIFDEIEYRYSKSIEAEKILFPKIRPNELAEIEFSKRMGELYPKMLPQPWATSLMSYHGLPMSLSIFNNQEFVFNNISPEEFRRYLVIADGTSMYCPLRMTQEYISKICAHSMYYNSQEAPWEDLINAKVTLREFLWEKREGAITKMHKLKKEELEDPSTIPMYDAVSALVEGRTITTDFETETVRELASTASDQSYGMMKIGPKTFQQIQGLMSHIYTKITNLNPENTH